ncbi:nuclear transport factor 2 family protein [Georgenia sp. Z1491]|uniref:nuclear transport factor 2 family protein n=1 Tax=Georgenia sp. Z1491 TaxID=3416707 RepID=UPI003CE852E2
MSTLTTDHLLALEHRGWDALCSSTGGSFYGELMTPEAVMILVNGMVLDRATVARSLDESPPWSSYSLTGARVVPTGERSAALVYTATASRQGDETPFVALMASHYCVVDGETRLALYQQTTVTH